MKIQPASPEGSNKRSVCPCHIHLQIYTLYKVQPFVQNQKEYKLTCKFYSTGLDIFPYHCILMLVTLYVATHGICQKVFS